MYKRSYSCQSVNLGKLLKRFYRGIQITNSELQKQTENIENSPYKLLSNNDIEDCLISDSAKQLGIIDIKYEKFVISDSDVLVLTKMGPNFKIGITQCSEGEKFLVSSNLFALEVNKELVNPYYLLYFLNSEAGKELLKNHSAGSNIPTLNNDDINNLEIPLPDKEIQDNLAEKMKIAIDGIRVAKKEYKMKKNQISELDSVFEALLHK